MTKKDKKQADQSKSLADAKPSNKHNLNEEVRFTQKVAKSGLRNVASHHIESFNYALGTCLPRICKNMLPVEISAAV